MGAQSVSQVDRVVAGLYEAAAIPELWPTAMRAVADHVGATSADLYRWSAADGYDATTPSSGIEPGMRRVYADYYVRIDPLIGRVLPYGPGTIFNCADHVEAAEVERSEYYQDYMLRWGHRYLAAAPLEAAPDSLTAFSLMRPPEQGPFEGPALARIAEVAPHLHGAIPLQRELKGLRLQQDLAIAALDRMATSALVIGEDGRILAANTAAEALLAEDSPLRVRAGRLQTGGDGADALAEAQRVATRRKAPAARGWRGRSADGGIVTAVFVPLPDRWLAAPAALALVDGGGSADAIADETLRTMFGLSRAERALVLGLLRGQTLDEIAAGRSVSVATVRVQLRSALAKTGCERQGDLLRLLAGHARLRNPAVASAARGIRMAGRRR